MISGLILAGLFAILSSIGAKLLFGSLRREQRLQRRVAFLQTGAPPAQKGSTSSSLVSSIAAIGDFVVRSGLFSAKSRADSEEMLASLGLQVRNALGLFLGAKLVFFLIGPMVVFFAMQSFPLPAPFDLLAPAIASVAGLLLPDMVVRRMRKRYLNRVEKGVPDALDMLVLCAQAGLGIESAIDRVAREIPYAHPEVGRELQRTLDEMRVSVDRQSAFSNMAARTQLDSVKRVMTTLAQTLQYGTPLTESLRSSAVEMRQMALTRYEERAARLPVLLTLPMIVFIFPCVFIVIGGPAVLYLLQAFSR